MRPVVAAVAIWTVVAPIVLTFDGYSILDMIRDAQLGCLGLVSPSPACLDRVSQANEAMWWLYTLPRLALIAVGYVAIAAVWLRGKWRRRAETPL